MSYLQSAYIIITKPVASINSERNRRVRDIVVFLCFFCMFALILLYNSRAGMFRDDNGELSSLESLLFGFSHFQNAVISGVLLFVAALLSAENGIRKIQWNWFIGYIWLFFSVLIVISGLFHNIGSGSVISQIIIALILPMLFLAWQSRDDSERLYVLIAYAILALVIIAGLISIIMFPLADNTVAGDTTRYRSFLNNPNRLGFLAVTGAVAAIYLCGYMKKFWVIIPAATLGMCMQLAWLTKSRSALLAMLLALMIGMLLHIKNRDSIKKLMLFILIAIVLCVAASPLLTRDTAEMEAYEPAPVPLVAVAKAAEDDAIGRLINGDESTDFTSGRIQIWREYLKYVNATGNDVGYYLPIRVIDEERGYSTYFSMAHNTPLEVTFRSGIIAGGLFMLFELIAFWYVIVRLLGRRKNLSREDLFACPAMIAFFATSMVETMLESVNGVFTTNVTLMFFLACGMLFTFGVKKDVNNTKDEIEE